MLNKDQQAVANDFYSFLLSDEKEFLIDASAGYGKSYLIKYLATDGINTYNKGASAIGSKTFEVALTATTNKAAEALEVATNLPTRTIHNLLGLIVKPNFSTGEEELKASGKTQIIKRTVIFIDECSMIDNQLFDFIHKLTHECKLVYVGDKYQLTPVRSGLSPVYKNNLVEHTLTIPMRNANHKELVDLCTQLKKTVETGVFNPIKLVPGIIDLYDKDQMAKAYQKEFVVNNGQDARSLTYTNKMSVIYNNYIKSIRGQTEVFNDGDFCISNSVCCLGNKTLHAEDEIYIKKVIKRHVQRQLAEGFQPVELSLCEIEWHGQLIETAIPESYHQVKNLLKALAKAKEWYQYFAIKEGFLDLRPRDSCTIHKAQGSTLNTVFIDAKDLSTCTVSSTTARLLYVAVSRAKSHVIFYGDLKSKYGKFV